MNVLVFALGAATFFSAGLLVGGFMCAVGSLNNSYDVWECTNTAGHTYWLLDPSEVEAALKVDGMLAVRRLRVLT